MGIKYGHMACCTTKYLFPQESFLPRWPCLVFFGCRHTPANLTFSSEKKSPHAEEVWWAHWSLWKIKKKLGATSSEFLWSKSSQLSWNFAAFVIYKSPQNRQEIDKLLPLGARWIPATSNQWMIFSQSMFSEQFRWSILPKSQPEEAQETARNARNPWENWWFLYLSCFRSQF